MRLAAMALLCCLLQYKTSASFWAIRGSPKAYKETSPQGLLASPLPSAPAALATDRRAPPSGPGGSAVRH